ncbi:MAG TPA: glycosyltransferase family 87 protein [Candidatus Binataceae bacterium]|nr:glycosyltransferase family 87 protein [Candidatus Binataceae bacterium]
MQAAGRRADSNRETWGESALPGPLAQRVGRIATQTPVIVLLCVVALLSLSIIFAELPARAHRWDFSHYYVSALVLRKGGNPYVTDLRPSGARLGVEIGQIDRATYPPTFYLLLEPLTLLPVLSAYWVWIALTTVELAAALYLLFGPTSGLSARAGVAASAVALSYGPIGFHYHFAQCQILILLMIVAMVRLMERGREAGAAAMLAAATLLRVFPILLIGYLVVIRRWRMLWWTGVWLAAGALVTVALVGFDRSVSFFRVVPFIASDAFIREYSNVSTSGFIAREFSYVVGGHPSATLIEWRRITTLAAELGILALTVAATLRAGKTKIDQDWRALSLWIVAIIMLSPTAWVHYFVLLIFVFAQMLVAASRGRISGRALWAAFVGFAIVEVVQPLVVSIVTHNGADPQALLRYHRGIGAIFIMTRAELSFFSLLAMFVAGYWFVSDPASPDEGLAAI